MSIEPRISDLTLTPSGTQTVAIEQTSPNNRVATIVDFSVTTDTFTVPATGTTITNEVPHRGFAIQVKGTVAVASAWTVVLEGSIDGTNFTTILTHTQALGENILWSGANLYAVISYRTRLVNITLGPATNIVVTVLGTT